VAGDNAFDLDAWVQHLREKHPELGQIVLIGSRARGQARPDSDYDIVIVVGEVDEGREQAIAAEVDSPEVDLFFLRPIASRRGFGRLRRWGDPPPTEFELKQNDASVVRMRETLRTSGLAHGLLSDETVKRVLENGRPL
jgi:predicted nucleotidyltransferase